MQPDISYLVCGTPRSGSSLLCEALINTRIAGDPEEYFLPRNESKWQKLWGTPTYAEYLENVIKQAATSNGVFGSKLMWGYFDNFVTKARQIPAYSDPTLSDHQLLQSIFPNLHYIWIRRQDKVRQAISHAKARQTEVWTVVTDTKPMLARKPVFSFARIDFMVKELEAQDAAWQQYFMDNGIKPFEVVYEDLALRYEEIAIQALQYLGIPGSEAIVFAPRRMRKQSDDESEEWVKRYLQLKAERKRYRMLSYANGQLINFLSSTRLGLHITKKRVY